MKIKTMVTFLLAGIGMSCSNLLALTSDEQADILFMKQEEKLARDVYKTLYEKYEFRVFANIARSEQRHMDSVDYLIETFGLADRTPQETGVFTYDELNTLYAELVEKGNKSAIDALEVGVMIEEVDIADLEEALETTTDVTIKNVFGNLLRASYNHLNAFKSNLTAGTDSQLSTPQLQFGRNNQGGVCVVTGETTEGTQRQLQSRGIGNGEGNGNGKGNQWRGERGNADGTAAQNGNAGVPNHNQNQFNVDCDPNNPQQLRLRDSNGNQVRYSNILNTGMVNTPWPNAERIGKGWFASWMGDVNVAKYPVVYIERFGWMTIESFQNGELVWSDQDGNKYMTTEAKYPAYFDYQSGNWM